MLVTILLKIERIEYYTAVCGIDFENKRQSSCDLVRMRDQVRELLLQVRAAHARSWRALEDWWRLPIAKVTVKRSREKKRKKMRQREKK